MSDAQLSEAFERFADSIHKLAESNNKTMRWFLIGMLAVAVVMVMTLMAILHDLDDIRKHIGEGRIENAQTVNVARPPTDKEILIDVLNEIRRNKQ